MPKIRALPNGRVAMTINGATIGLIITATIASGTRGTAIITSGLHSSNGVVTNARANPSIAAPIPTANHSAIARSRMNAGAAGACLTDSMTLTTSAPSALGPLAARLACAEGIRAPGTPSVPRPFQDTLGPSPLPVREPVRHEHPHEHSKLRPRRGRSGEVLPEKVRTVDDHEPTKKPGIVRAEAELPVLDDDLGCVADPAEPGEAIREV